MQKKKLNLKHISELTKDEAITQIKQILRCDHTNIVYRNIKEMGLRRIGSGRECIVFSHDSLDIVIKVFRVRHESERLYYRRMLSDLRNFTYGRQRIKQDILLPTSISVRYLYTIAPKALPGSAVGAKIKSKHKERWEHIQDNYFDIHIGNVGVYQNKLYIIDYGCVC